MEKYCLTYLLIDVLSEPIVIDWTNNIYIKGNWHNLSVPKSYLLSHLACSGDDSAVLGPSTSMLHIFYSLSLFLYMCKILSMVLHRIKVFTSNLFSRVCLVCEAIRWRTSKAMNSLTSTAVLVCGINRYRWAVANLSNLLKIAKLEMEIGSGKRNYYDIIMMKLDQEEQSLYAGDIGNCWW